MRTIGLTGGIASGKSTAAKKFSQLGVPVCDADQVARQVVSVGSDALAQIFETFGSDFQQADGSLNRSRMRELVFREPAAKLELEKITHPAIRQGMLNWREQQRAPYCIFDVAILFESGFDALVDRSLVIDAPEAEQVRRVMERDGSSHDAASRIIASQMSRAERCARATDRIRNDASLDRLLASVAVANRRYMAWSHDARLDLQPFDLPESDASATM